MLNRYFIHESNLERLEKKIQTIKNKCTKNNISFTYNIVDEKFVECTDTDGREYFAKYYEVEVSGFMKHEGWRFAAVLEHKAEGNIIRSMDYELSIPEKYRTCGPECEHCHRIRSRKDTYVVYNEETNEFKQVGKQCLQEYTNGLDAEEAARYISMFDEMIKGEYYGGSSYKSYLNVEDVVRYAFECVRHFGYEKSSEFSDRTTRSRVSDYMRADSHGLTSKTYEAIKKEMDEVGFDANSEYAVNTSKEALEWIRSEADTSDYIYNLRLAAAEEYAETRDFGLLVSLPVAYLRHIEKLAEYKQKEEQKAEEQKSEYVGELKDKLTINAHNFMCVTTLFSQFGTTFLYKWSDDNGNIFIWYASNGVDDPETVIEITGTVKDHSEYNGVKQTVMTRCKVTRRTDQAKDEQPVGSFDLDDIMSVFE